MRHGSVFGPVLMGIFVLLGCATAPKTPSLSVTGAGSASCGTGDLGVLTSGQESFSEALAHYATGLIHLSQGESNEALEEWERVVALDSSREDLREKIIQEYFRRNDYKKAAEVLEGALQQDPSSHVNWMLLAVAYRADKQWENASKAAEKAIHLDPLKFPPYEVLFDVAVEHQDLPGARRVLDRAAKQKSEDDHFWMRLADLSLALSARDPSLKIDSAAIMQFYDKALALQPDDASILVRVADYCVMNQNLAKAIELYQKVLDSDPNAENIRLKLALSHVAQGDKRNAIAILEELVKREPLRYQIFTLIGELYEESKDFDLALHNYRLSLSVNPDQLPPHLKIVLLQMKAGRPKEALAQLDEAREKFPNTPQISYFYGLVYGDLKDYPRALENFEEAYRLALVSNPDLLDAVFRFYYGAALERTGHFDAAVEQFRKAIELKSDYADAYNYLGFMYAEKNINLNEALDLVEKSLSYEPNNGAFLDSLGWVYYRMGRFEDALLQLQRATQLIKNDATVYEHLGDVYRQMGNSAGALQQYEKAAELDPKNTDIFNKMDAIKSAISANQPISDSH